MNHAYGISLDVDDGRFTLTVSDDEGDHTYEIHAVALEFYAEVRRVIGPWADEAALARATMPHADDADAYDPSDPKHPGWHDAMAEMWDNRKGK